MNFKIGNNCRIHPDTKIGNGTIIRDNVEIREGVEIGMNCYIDTGVTITGDARIGDFCIIRNNVTIARGTEMGQGCFIAPNCMFNNLDLGVNNPMSIGGAKLGENVKIGTATVLHHGINICDDVTIGAMSFVRHDIEEPGTYYTPHNLVKK